MNKLGREGYEPIEGVNGFGHGFGALIEAKTYKDGQALVNAYETLRSLTIALMRPMLTEKDVNALANAYDTLRNLALIQVREHVELLYAIEAMKGGVGGRDAEARKVVDLCTQVQQLTAKNDVLEARILKLEEKKCKQL